MLNLADESKKDVAMSQISLLSSSGNYVTVSAGCCGDSNYERVTEKSQRYQLIKILTLTLIPLIALSITTAMNVVENTPDYASKDKMRQAIQLSLQVGNVVHYTQLERGASVMYISSEADPIVLDLLQDIHNGTEKAVRQLTLWPEISSGDPAHFRSKESYFAQVDKYRDFVLNGNATLKTVINLYTADNQVFIGWLSPYMEMSVSGNLWKTLIAYHVLLLAKDDAGIERALGSHFYASGNLSSEMLLWYIEKKTTAEKYLILCSKYSSIIDNMMKESLIGTELSDQLTVLREQILTNSLSDSSSHSSIHWFDNMTTYINILKNIQDTVGQNILVVLREELDVVNTNYTISIGLLVGAVLLYPCILLVVYIITKKMQLVALSLKEKTSLLSKERKRSQNLLCEMLPVSVATKLMMNERVEPSLYQSATVFFSDVVGFTTICSGCTPLEVVDMLNLIYKTFDSRLEKYDVYKVETIGDAYMVVSGVPDANGERHVSEISHMALDILEASADLDVPQLKNRGLGFDVRIGINTGPVVSGVVGLKMPRYCLFGDTVNVASRMESTGKPRRIQISEATAKALRQFNNFKTQERGVVEIKGKGQMRTYWLLRSVAAYEFRNRDAMTFCKSTI